MRKEEVLELLAWVWLAGSIIGGMYLGFTLGILIAIAVAIQGAVFSVFLLVFSDLASTISMLDDRVKNLDKYLQKIVNKDDRPAQSAVKAKPVVSKRSDGNIAETMNIKIKNKDEADNENIACNSPLVSLRSGPGDDYDFVGKVKKGMALSVLHRQNEWIKVQTKEGLEGWLKDLYVYKI
jgi:hypothetical protein